MTMTMGDDVYFALMAGAAVQLVFELVRFGLKRQQQRMFAADSAKAMEALIMGGTKKRYDSVNDLPAGTYSVTSDGKFERN